ncbi:hypothetical protein ACFQYP_63710 [Nonomuraea antimicrobica]
MTTYRRDGTPVATPLRVAQDGDAVVVWTVRRGGTGTIGIRITDL